MCFIDLDMPSGGLQKKIKFKKEQIVDKRVIMI